VSYDFRGDPILGPAFEYWEAKRGARAMPRRVDIDPSEITKLLPNVQITELVDGGARVRYRLVGTAIVTAYGAELTGKYFDEVFSGDRLRFVEDNYRVMCLEKRPILVGNRYISRKDVELFCYRIVMPLSEDGTAVNQALTAMTFKYPGAADQSHVQWLEQGDEFDPGTSFAEVIR
jgi:hypothetical protein